MDTCEREVGQVITSQVLFRYDMFDVVGGLSVFLAMETVFATIPGTQAHQLITPARKFRVLLHINPTRQRGKRTGSLAGAF